jgi:sugar phosphate isomerase/epimerase
MISVFKYHTMNNRREFIKQMAVGATFLQLPWLASCNPKSTESTMGNSSGLKISLAQWSIHRALEAGTLKAADFPALAKQKYNLDAVEYVNGFYRDKVGDEKFWNQLKQSANENGVQSLLIMVDDEGDLGNPEATQRKLSVENHYKWVHAAALLGCHSIRVNAFGEGSKEAVQQAMVDSMSELCEYAAKESINVVIENHGLYSSDGTWIAEIMKQVNKPNCGTLPDFGNWCLAAKWGTTQGECLEVYDRYQGVSEMLPYAKGVSAKSYEFDVQGNETRIDYARMLQLVKDSGFQGHIGIEFEGLNLGEHEGILATKALLEKTINQLALP